MLGRLMERELSVEELEVWSLNLSRREGRKTTIDRTLIDSQQTPPRRDTSWWEARLGVGTLWFRVEITLVVQ